MDGSILARVEEMTGGPSAPLPPEEDERAELVARGWELVLSNRKPWVWQKPAADGGGVCLYADGLTWLRKLKRDRPSGDATR